MSTSLRREEHALSAFSSVEEKDDVEDLHPEPEKKIESKIICGVEISPSEIHFKNFKEGGKQIRKITLQNRSKTNVHVVIFKPEDESLHLRNCRPHQRYVLFPGLILSKYLAYKTTKRVFESSIDFVIDYTRWSLPIYTHKCVADIRVHPDVIDFGILNIGGKFADKTITLKNYGSGPSKWKVIVGTNPLQVDPKYGFLKPQEKVQITFRAAGVKIGHHKSTIWIDSSSGPKFVRVSITSILPCLMVYHPIRKGYMTVLSFGVVYYGTCAYESFIIRNYSAEPTIYVLTFQKNRRNMVYETMECCKMKKWLHVWPLSGVLDPFESHVFSVCFRPYKIVHETGWKSQSQNIDHSLWTFFKVEQVAQKATNVEKDVSTIKKRGSLKLDMLMKSEGRESAVCVHGEAEEADIICTPNIISMTVAYRQEGRTVVKLTNASARLPIHFELVQPPYISTEPTTGILNTTQSMEVLIIFRAKSLGSLDAKLICNVKSYCNATDQQELITLKKKIIKLELFTISQTKQPEPKFIQGITPFIAQEVGIHTDGTKFTSDLTKIPKAAVVSVNNKLIRKPWFLDPSNTIAFPNDMALKLVVHRHDETKRSIFTGAPRYLPPPKPDEAINAMEIFKINELKDTTRKFIRSFIENKMGDLRLGPKYTDSKERIPVLLRNPKRSLPSIKPTFVETKKTDLQAALTPTQLYNICISPSSFNFGLIPVGEECTLVLTFENSNTFPVKFNFKFEDKLKFPYMIVLKPKSKESYNLNLQIKFTGKFISYFHYIICDVHNFYKTIRAEVVQPFVRFTPSTLDFTIPKSGDMFTACYKSVVIRNPFSTPTSFEWLNNQKHIIELIPERGHIKENDTITCLVYVLKFFKTRKKVTVKLMAGDWVVSALNCYIPSFTDYRITSMSPTINIKTLPAGTTIVKKAYLFNYGCYKTTYWIKTASLIEGIEVHPKCGVIPPKSLETLEIHFKMNRITMLKFDLIIDIEDCSLMKIQILGNIIYPLVEMEPKELDFLSTKCYSISTQSVKITNKTAEDLTLTFHMEKYVQFKLTTSPQHYESDLNNEVLILKANATQIIYVHFKPMHIAAYEFYLPICINGLLGPLQNVKGSNLSSNFMVVPAERSDGKRAFIPDFFNSSLKPPLHFDAVWVSCVVRPPELIFSSFEVHFEALKPRQLTSKKIHLINPTEEVISVQISKVRSPFSVATVKGDKFPIKIEPDEKVELVLSFQTLMPGSWSAACPVMLIKNQSSVFYNDLFLSGICHPSSLFCPTTELYFIPAPLGTRLDKRIYIFAYHQRTETELKVTNFCKTNNIDRKIGIDFPEGPIIPKNVDGVIIPVVISFFSPEVISFEVKLFFRDGMEGEVEITMFATATDSLIPNHWFYFSAHFEDEDSEKTGVAVYKSGSIASRESVLRRVFGAIGWRDSEIADITTPSKPRYSSISTIVMPPCGMRSEISPNESMEDGYNIYYWSKIHAYVMRWLLYCVFNGSYQPRLEDITWSQGFIDQSKLKNYLATTKTFVDLIIALFGSEILAKTNLSSEIPSPDKYIRIKYCLKAYSKILSYLDLYGVGLSHISPLYLLNFEDYQQLYEWRDNRDQPSIIELPTTMKTKTEYLNFSKRMWLEFYLQLFKSHTLDMCVGLAVIDDWPKLARQPTEQSSVTLSGISFDKMSPITKIITGDMLDQVSQDRSHSEAVLLAWLSRTYNKVREDETMDLPALEDNKILDLGPSLRNGIVLAGVTAYYCPFLVDLLSHLKMYPTMSEEVYHNATYLILAWDEVRLGMMTKPDDLVECNPIFMMMLVAYLYLSLPSFLPTYLLRAAVPLGDAGTSILSVTNSSNYELRYYVKVFQDPSEPFSIFDRKPIYILKPKHTIDLKVHFVSNRISKETGLLVLCGSNGPKIHGTNLCVRLEGEPTTITVSNKIVVRLPLYEQVYLYQRIFSPYAKSADYTVAISTEKPSLDMSHLRAWHARKDCLIPMQLTLGSSEMYLPPCPKFGTLHLACCLLINAKAVRWLTFSSPLAGDFVCKIVLIPYPERNPKIITVGFPLVSSEERNQESFIPIDLKLPSANASLMKASLEILSLTVSSDEVYFYKKFWGRYIGLKLFEMEILENCPDFTSVLKIFFDHTVTYNITCDSKLIDVQKTITINDVHSEEVVYLPIRIKTCANKPFTALLKLCLPDNQEVRTYWLHLVPTKRDTMHVTNQ